MKNGLDAADPGAPDRGPAACDPPPLPLDPPDPADPPGDDDPGDCHTNPDRVRRRPGLTTTGDGQDCPGLQSAAAGGLVRIP